MVAMYALAQRGQTAVDDTLGKPLVADVLAARHLVAVASLHPADPRARDVGQREEPSRDDAVLLGSIDLHRAVRCRPAARVAVDGIARIDERSAIHGEVDVGE